MRKNKAKPFSSNLFAWLFYKKIYDYYWFLIRLRKFQGGSVKVSLDEMATFVEVVDSGSQSIASKKTGVPLSTVSRRIADLERRLRVQLIQRSSHQQNTTDAGSVYYDYCSRMLDEANAAEIAMQSIQKEPFGVLRILSLIPIDDPFLSNMLDRFLCEYSEVTIEYFTVTTQLDLSEQRFDCVFMMGEISDPTLIARELGCFKTIYCASPDYLKKYGMPSNASDLSGHHFAKSKVPDWVSFQEPSFKKGDFKQKMDSRILTNDFFSLRRLALDGICIAQIPDIHIYQHLEAGMLVEVLPRQSIDVPIYLAFSKKKQFTTKVRAFIDHAVTYTRECAPWILK